MSKPLKIQIVERARALIADEEHWCRGELARDARGMGVCPITDSAVKRCGLGAAYEITGGHRAAYDLHSEPCNRCTAPPHWLRSMT